MSETKITPDSYRLTKLKPEGHFSSPVRNTHRKERYSFTEGDKVEQRILKYLPLHSARAEVIGSTIFQVLGLRSPKTYIAEDADRPAVVMEDLSEDSVADLTYGEGGVMTDPLLKEQFKHCLLAAILVGDYDRVPWNAMISRDFSRVAFVDFGASCGSRAQGGYNGFNPWIDAEEIRQAIADPYDLNIISNQAFKEVIDLQDGKVVAKDPQLLAELASQLSKLTDEVVDVIVAIAKYPDVGTAEGMQKSKVFVDEVAGSLQEQLRRFNYPESRDYIKSKRALDTYARIATSFGYDMGAYFAFALKKRRDALIEMFSSK